MLWLPKSEDHSHEIQNVIPSTCCSDVVRRELQRSKKWLVRGLVKFATAVARLVCPDLLG